MPKCPECGEEINSLKVKATDYGELTVDEDGNLNYEWSSDIYGDQVKTFEYRCPICGATVFFTSQDAEDFLQRGNGRQNLQRFI